MYRTQFDEPCSYRFLLSIFSFHKLVINLHFSFNEIHSTDQFIVIVFKVICGSVILPENLFIYRPLLICQTSLLFHTFRFFSNCAITVFMLHAWAGLQPENFIYSSFVIFNMKRIGLKIPTAICNNFLLMLIHNIEMYIVRVQ